MLEAYPHIKIPAGVNALTADSVNTRIASIGEVYSLEKSTDVSEERIARIFRVEEDVK
jgi:hypothetical protein